MYKGNISEKIEKTNNFYIKQTLDISAYISCFSNVHFEVIVKETIDNIEKFVILLDCLEDSSYCNKNCLSNSNRPFNLKIKESQKIQLNELNVNHFGNNIIGMPVYNRLSKFDFETDLFANMQKDYTCTCCYCIRPTLNVYLYEDNKSCLSHSVVEQYSCYDPILNIIDNGNEKKFFITTECCKCGYYCCSCCSIENIVFKIISYSNNELIGKITKLRYQEIKYEVTISSDKLSFNDKFEIITSVMFLDSILNFDGINPWN